MKIRRAAITPETTISSEDVVDGEEAFGFVVNFHVENMPEWHFRAASEEERENWLIKLNQAHAISKWLNEYQRVKILGIGGQGIVYELLHTSTGRHWAMKEIEIKSERQMAAAVAEAQFLKRIVEKVAHPNILHIEKVFQVGSKFFMVFPLCTGGELYDAVVSKGHFTEHDAAKIFREIMGALEALHDQNILHLDIKPENILLESREPDAKVFVTDFGLSKFSSDLAKQPPFNEKDFVEKRTRCMFHHEISMEHVRGTYGYMSPEVILLGYSSAAADVFAAGVVLYILLCGYPPFHHRSHREKLIATVSGSYRLEGEEWDFISDEAKDLLRRMLETNPLQRITAKEVMAHPWVVNIDDADFPFAVKSMSSLASTSHDEATTKAAVEDTLKALKLSAPATINSTTSTVKTVSSGSRHTNLSAAVHNLASHVQSLKSERMAATITKLMSAGGKAAGYSHLAEQYLYTLKAAGGETNSVAVEEGSAGVKALVNRTVINPPRYITAKHVSAIFEQLGYDPVAGAKVFEVLCEALQRIRHPNGRNNFDDEISAPILEEDAEDDEDGGDDEQVHAGTAAGGTAATAASATATGAAATAAHGSDIPPPAPPSASKKGALHHDEAHELQALASTQATVGSDIAETSITSSAKAKISFGRPFRLRPAQPTTRIAQMDVNDFIRAAHIDNVLVQVFFRQTHAKIYELIQRARRRVVEEQRVQAALPPEQRKEVSIERIFEEDIARIFDNQ
eukprot:gene5415-3858_t